MRVLFVMILLAVLVLPPVAVAEVQPFTATHTYILGDHDSKDDARQRCLLETKRKILEQAGVYIESASEVKDLQLTKDRITSFAAAVMQVKDTKENVGFENGHMTLTLKADVDLAEVRKQLAARQVDASVRDDVAAQKERLKRLEAQLKAMQRQVGQAPGQPPVPPTRGISAAGVQTLHRLAAQGNAVAQFELAEQYFLGLSVPQDYAKAHQWFEKAAAQGHEGAQAGLSMVYDFGQGAPLDYVQARQWYEKAAAQGNDWAQVRLGSLYVVGRGVPQDYVQARQWYEKAAAQGNDWAQVRLGLLYHLGDGVPQDYVQARQWYEKAAAQGNGYAQDRLGYLYYLGDGVPQDYVQARQWYEKAAAQGNASTQVQLGSLYNDGRGVPQDYVQARQWYERAAAQSNASAQFRLGILYEFGNGVPQDYVRAYMWYYLAAANYTGESQEITAKYGDEVARRMTPAQLAKAQRLAQQCQAQQFKGC